MPSYVEGRIKEVKEVGCLHQKCLRIDWNINTLLTVPTVPTGTVERLELVHEAERYEADWLYDPITTTYVSLYIALSIGQHHERHCNIEVNLKTIGTLAELCQNPKHYWTCPKEKADVFNHMRKQITDRIITARDLLLEGTFLLEPIVDLVIEDYFQGY
jgi:hypothetical protein